MLRLNSFIFVQLRYFIILYYVLLKLVLILFYSMSISPVLHQKMYLFIIILLLSTLLYLVIPIVRFLKFGKNTNIPISNKVLTIEAKTNC